ncbi:MAG: hypothetical protein HC782_03770 [Gammaproteobacteria bacterium]|nr:hypothetical protein [Gammaproteobacteria bacterium]
MANDSAILRLFHAHLSHLIGGLVAVVMVVFALYAHWFGQYSIGLWIAIMLSLSLVVVVTSLREWAIPTMRTLIGWALLARVIGMLTPAFFEDDYYRYLWDGYRTFIDGNPYLAAPSAWFGATNLPSKIDAVLSQVNYPDVPTIYGPALQHLFAVLCMARCGRIVAVEAHAVRGRYGVSRLDCALVWYATRNAVCMVATSDT